MSEKIEDVSFEKNKENNDLKKYEPAIRKLLEEFKETRRKSENNPKWTETVNFDISNPHPEDMEKFWSGDFELENFFVLEIKGEVKGFNFYIGKTEFIIRGAATEKILEYKENQ